MSLSQILRISTGFINQVNDPVVGMPAVPGGTGQSQFLGQLGKRVSFDQDDVHYNNALGTVYGGTFRYVRLAAAAAVPVVGQLLFWDLTVAPDLYQVTTVESGTADSAIMIAGVCLTPNLTVGNYTIIQDQGIVNVKFAASLTSAGAIGSRCYAAAMGGSDLGFADVLSSANPTDFSDVSLMQGRYIGNARTAPTGASLTPVYFNLRNYLD